MKVIGLTGGMGTGKSTVSNYLKQKGIPIIDADQIAHSLTQKGSPVLEQIRQLLGGAAFREDGELDRKAVAQIVFHDRQKLEQFEELTTKEVVLRCQAAITAYRREGGRKIIIVDAPLLFECGLQHWTDENWLISADLAARIERIEERDGLSKEEILDRINNQMASDEKEALADHIFDNSSDLNWLYQQIDFLLERINNEG